MRPLPKQSLLQNTSSQETKTDISGVITHSTVFLDIEQRCSGSINTSDYYAIAISNPLQFFSMWWIEITIAIAKMGAQPILIPNGNRNRAINLRSEWTIRAVRQSCEVQTNLVQPVTLLAWFSPIQFYNPLPIHCAGLRVTQQPITIELITCHATTNHIQT